MACSVNYSKLLVLEDAKKESDAERRGETYQRRRMLSRSTSSKIIQISDTEETMISPVVELKKEGRKHHANSLDATLDAYSKYSEKMTSKEPALLAELRVETAEVFGPNVRMLSGHLQGRFLTMLAGLSQAENVLELGTFTG